MVKTIVLTEHNKVASVYDEDRIITDLIIERGSYQIGDIYIGIVKTLLPSINAAFISLDKLEANGFLHIKNLGHLKKNRNITNITNHLFCNETVMVQVLKAPNGRKGPTLTGEIIIKGRYLNLLPFEKGILFPKGFENHNEILHFKALFSMLKPKSMGVIFNKTALSTSSSNIVQDFYALLHEWDDICKNVNSFSAPFLVSRNGNFISKTLQKVYTEKIHKIIVDSYEGSKKIAFIINRWAKKNDVVLSIKYFNNYNLLIRDYNLDLIIYDLLQSRINLLGGGYIYIEKTEALTTIDVNSGSFNYLNNPRETILLVNRRAAKQIARHIRLRNISGVIVIDFIDMKNQQDQLDLLVYFDSLLKEDEKKPRIIQFSELGLVELTRKRECKGLIEIFYGYIRGAGDSNRNICISNIISKYSLGHTLFLETQSTYSGH